MKYIVLNWGEEHVKTVAASVSLILDRPRPETVSRLNARGCVSTVLCASRATTPIAQERRWRLLSGHQ